MSQKLVFTPPNNYQHESEKLSAPYCECSGTSLIALYPYKLLNMSYEFNNSNNGSLPFATYWGGRNTPSTKIILTNVCCDIGDKLDATSYQGGGRYIECYGYSTKYYWIYVSLKKSGDDDNKVYYIVGRYLISDIPNHEINERLDVSDQNIVLTTELWPNYCYRGVGNKTFQSIAFPEYIVKNSSFINLRGLHNFYNRQHALDDIAYLKRSDLTSNNVLVLTKSQVEEYNLLTSTSTVSDSQLQSVSASKLQGKAPLASIPIAALERVHNVADETARFALTTATVQNGDVIHQQDDHSQYYVVDDTKLNNAAGYKKITKVALQVPWTGLTDKPVYFQPTPHSHGNITNDGYLGETANLPLITGSNGTIIAGSFGTEAHTFCEGNDSRLSDAREPLNHGSNKVTALTGYVAGGVSTSGPISSEDTLNQALGKIEFRVADYKDSLSMSNYSVQAKAAVTTSDTIQTAIGKIEGGYLARKYATADDIAEVLFGVQIDHGYDDVYNILTALGVSIDEDGNFHDIPINGYTATNEVLALNADGTVSHENSYPSSYTRKFGVESYELSSYNYLTDNKLYCRDRYYGNDASHNFSSAVQAVLNFFIVSKFAPSEIKQPIMLTNMAVGARGYGCIALDKSSGDLINCIIFDTEGHWGTIGYSNLSSTPSNFIETTGIITLDNHSVYVNGSQASYIECGYNNDPNYYNFSSWWDNWRSEVQLNVQSVVNYLSYVLALKNTTISAVLAMPFYSA